MPTTEQLAVMARHYVIACIWADCPEGTHPRTTKTADAIALATCTRFAELAGDLLTEAVQRPGYGSHPDCGTEHPGYAAAGHDLYLTSAEHGVGFWDRDPLDEGNLGKRLSALCGWRNPIPEPQATFYRGWLYLS
jgi:hypothetical protein